jgi:sec-independent protein translocase protein TatC
LAFPSGNAGDVRNRRRICVLPDASYIDQIFTSFETRGTAGAMGIQLQAKVSGISRSGHDASFCFRPYLPITRLLTLLARIGIVTSQSLRSMRRYAILGLFAFANVVTLPSLVDA